MSTVIIPVKDALQEFRQMYQSLVKNASKNHTIIIVDDASGEKTRKYIENLDVVSYISKEHLWTNRAWDKGVSLAKDKWVYIFNSDIILPEKWDEKLVEDDNYDVISPVNTSKFHNEFFPHMINGSCFMARRSLFPLVGDFPHHWFGDNKLSSYRVKFIDYTSFSFTHIEEGSARNLPKDVYFKQTYEDSIKYQKICPEEERVGVAKIVSFCQKRL